MQIVGHRGAAGLAPESTRASLQAAIALGVDWIEFDVHATKDGHVVLHHDPITFRATRTPHIIARHTYQTLRQLKVYKDHHILTLAEAFNVIRGQTKMVIEIKSKGCADTVVRQIEQAVKKGWRYQDIMVGSFKPERLREVQALNTHIPLLLFTFTRPLLFTRVRGLNLTAVGFYFRHIPRSAIRMAKLEGLKTYAYTVDNPKWAATLKAAGIDMIATNRPDIITK